MAEEAAPEKQATFTHGSTMRHVLVMSSTGAIGLLAIFFVDLANLFYISLLGQQALAAAIGFASTVMFFTVSICIGFTIAATAITARAIGAGDEEDAKKRATVSLVYMLIMTVVMVIIVYPLLRPILNLLGATGETLEIALGFMQIVIVSAPLLGLGMCMAGLLRAQGDAKRAMYVTLTSGASAAFIDPLLIFGLDLGVTGAALSVVVVRFMFVAIGIYGVWFVHRMLAIPDLSAIRNVFTPFMIIAVPAVLTQIATPFGNAYVTGAISQFGDDAVAGWAIAGRIMPLAFAGIFSLSGAVGPILGQNYGAGRIDRVRQTIVDSMIASAFYVAAMWILLVLFSPLIITVFGATGNAADLVWFFCVVVAASFLFMAALFVANAAFNNLGYPYLSTIFNWGRATLGVIPFVYVAQNWGPTGVLAGWSLGGVVFGTLAIVTCFAVIKRLPERAAKDGITISVPPSANSPFTSGKGALFGRIDTE